MLSGAVQCVFLRLQLGLKTTEDLQIALRLTGELANVFVLERADASFLLGELFARLVELILQEPRSVLGTLLSLFQVLRNE